MRILIFLLVLASCTPSRTKEILAKATTEAPTIDGVASDACWQNAEWHPIDQRWLGEPYTDEDFSGRYKLTWSEDFIYILAEVQDDTLIDIHEDGLDRYWDDDCLEIFIDEDHSGGNHQYSHNAFAYNIDHFAI
ncbi:MAG: sugar-binding protein [Bacteroidota bacterium]